MARFCQYTCLAVKGLFLSFMICFPVSCCFCSRRQMSTASCGLLLTWHPLFLYWLFLCFTGEYTHRIYKPHISYLIENNIYNWHLRQDVSNIFACKMRGVAHFVRSKFLVHSNNTIWFIEHTQCMYSLYAILAKSQHKCFLESFTFLLDHLIITTLKLYNKLPHYKCCQLYFMNLDSLVKQTLAFFI